VVPTREGLLAAVERLALRARRALDAREADVRAGEADLARAISASLAAHRLYFEAKRCLERPSEGQGAQQEGCEAPLRAALDVDPEFPLAHFELARMAVWQARPAEELRRLLAPAVARIERLPPAEQAQVRAWEAVLGGHGDRGAAILRDAARNFPEDAAVVLALGMLQYGENRLAESVEPLERAAALDPANELAADALVWVLGQLDRRDALARTAERMARSAPSAATLRGESRARAWLGEMDRALSVARRGAVGGGWDARENLADALVAAGQLDEAAALLREDADRGVDTARRRLGLLLLLRGRAREAETWLEPPVAGGDEPRLRFVAGARRASRRHAAERDAAAIARLVDETRAWSPEMAGTLAPLLAYSGDVDGAERLLPDLDPCPAAQDLVRALGRWRHGDPSGALSALRGFARAEPTAVACGLPHEAPAWMAAECAAEADSPERALGDVRRFQRFYSPLGLFRAWAYPRSLALEATLLERMGRPDEARVALARLETLWAEADSDLPLVSEARALRRRLGPGGASEVQASGGRRP
jgi:Flp pilus assembly protein TadD